MPVSGPQMLGPAFMAGIASGVLLGVPGTSICGLLWMLGGGVLAVFFFRKQFGRAALPNEAARLGLMSGCVGSLVAGVVAFISLAMIRRSPAGLIDHVLDYMRNSAELLKQRRPEEAAQIQQLIGSPGGAAAMLTILATFYFLFFVALSTLGGLLAGAFSRSRRA